MTRRRLRDDERALWQAVARSTKPLPDALRRTAKTPVAKIRMPQDPPEPSLLQVFEIGSKTVTPPKKPASSDTKSPAKPAMDKKTFGKLRRGKLVPEARIDLHGMTLDQAHPALTRFVLTSHTRGFRLVLVITGKGETFDPYDPSPQRRGILKRNVPIWLRMPPLNLAVLDVTEAHVRHGGGGAFYVYLRRTARS